MRQPRERIGFSSIAAQLPSHGTTASSKALDQANRRPSPSLSGDGQGLLLRPHRRKSAGGQGALRGRVPRLWCLYAAAQWQGRRVLVLQGVLPGRHRAALDARACIRCDGRLAGSVWPAAVVLRLVADACVPARGRRAASVERSCMAVGERGHGLVRELVGSAKRCQRGCEQRRAGVCDRRTARSWRLGTERISVPNPR
jgi:hypothetical protein